MRTVLFFIFWFLGILTKAEALVASDEFAHSERWLRLLYFEGANKNYKSLVRDPFFFFDPKGPDDPRAELLAALASFNQVLPASESHPQCRFPARYRLLRQYFELAAPVSCPQFEQWIRHYDPSSLILVYASQYLSNPASVFGHSFLMIPTKNQIKSFWLTFNYAANIPADAGGVAYVVGGLAGWYKGDYSVMPFYNRMFQYGSVENRDLWLYTIKLTPGELDFFLAHMWELVHSAHFTYYFLTENCAGVLLRTFAATLPDMANARRGTLYVHPMEVVKALDKAGRLASVELLPSQESKLRDILKKLNTKQRGLFDQAIAHPERDLTETDAPVSEALIEFTVFETQKNGGELPTPYKTLERSALVSRSRFADPPMDFAGSAALQQAPGLAHDSSMLQVGAGALAGTSTLNFGYRLAIHDQLDANPGFLKNSSIVGFDLKLSATRDAVWIQELNIASIDNFQPLLLLDPKATWRLKLAVRENLLTPSLTDEILKGQAGYGATLDVAGQYLYVLVTADFNAGSDLPQSRLEAGPELGAILTFAKLKILAGASAGQGLFDGEKTVYNRAAGGFSWQFKRNLNLVQQSEWTALPLKQIEGYRLDFGLRYYY